VRRGHLGGRACAQIEAHTALSFDVPHKLKKLGLKIDQVRRSVGAHVQAQGELSGHLCERMLVRVCMEAANGKGHRPARRVVRSPDFVEANREFACCKHHITAKAPGETHVRVFAANVHGRIAEVTGNAGADADRQTGFD